MNLGFQELMLVALVVLVLFGPKKLPEVARGLGKAMREFKKAKESLTSDVMREANLSEAERPDEKGKTGGAGKGGDT